MNKRYGLWCKKKASNNPLAFKGGENMWNEGRNMTGRKRVKRKRKACLKESHITKALQGRDY
jgi:hypothetical protein